MNTVFKREDFFDLYDGYVSPRYPELGSGPLPVEPYISPEYFERERERIFAKAWILIGNECEIPNPGDYFVKELPIFNTSVIIVRGQDGAVRGFHNACTHRGAELEGCGAAGNKRLFVCPYHSWSFDTQGDLKAVPERDRFLELDEKTCGLRPVSVESLGRGPIFLNIQAEPDVGLKEYLGELAQRLETYPFERMRLAHSSYVDLKANWKAASDAFLEGYHVGTVHKTTIPEGFKASRTNQARMNPGAFKICGRHRIASGPRSPSYEANPIERVSMEMGLPSFLQGIKPGEFLWPGLNFANVPLPTWTMDQHAIFPNSHIFIGQGFGWTHEFHPRSVGETRHEWRFYVAEPQTWSQRIGQYFLPVQAREGEMEDVAVIEKVQRGIAGGALKHIHLSDQEIAIRHQYRSIESLVRD